MLIILHETVANIDYTGEFIEKKKKNEEAFRAIFENIGFLKTFKWMNIKK